MRLRGGRAVSARATAAAFVRAQVRYWLTVAPEVRRELRRWQGVADRIDDPVLRAHAAGKLRDERGNTEAVATLCTLAPRRHRHALVVATVALQVMYDYLDAVTEQPVPGQMRSARQLFRTFTVALTPGEPPVDYYRYHPRRDDGGYLDALVASARQSIGGLPSLPEVLPVAHAAVSRFAEAQVRSHAVPAHGAAQLERWAAPSARATGLAWWEWAGGAAASILAVHALLSAASLQRTTRRTALRLDHAYLLASALTTMLDSLVDDRHDVDGAAHRYIAYYPDPDQTPCRLAGLARRAVEATRELPRPAHHALTVAGVAGYYLSTSDGTGGSVAATRRRVTSELGAVLVPIVAVFRLWRRYG